MMLAYPIGLLALAGLLIPVILHLWRINKGKTIKVGSIALLGESANATAKSLKLTDLLLFVLRCLILILIAFLLAQPFFKKVNEHKVNAGWILMNKAQFGAIYKSNQTTVDSLLAKGFELHDFNVGFKGFSLKDSIDKVDEGSELSYNALIHELNTALPRGYSAYIFADQKLSRFDGNLPTPNFNLVWKAINSPDTLKTWTTSFLGKTYEGTSTPRLTHYESNTLQQLPIVKVAIYDPKGQDSKYVKAALNAISDFTKRRFEMVAVAAQADLVCWLSDEPLPKSVTKAILYRKGKIEEVHSSLRINNEPNPSVELKKRIVFDQLKGEVIWEDGYGVPLLLKENKTKRYHFYSRFNPQWSDLVWSEQFVQALIPIVLSDEEDADFGFENHNADQRILYQQPFEAPKNISSGSSQITVNQPLDKALWIACFMLLIAERFLSLRNKTKLENA